MKRTFEGGVLLFNLGAIHQVFCCKLNNKFEDLTAEADIFNKLGIFADLFLSFWYFGLVSDGKGTQAKELIFDIDIARAEAAIKLEEYGLEAFSNDIAEFMQTFTTPPPTEMQLQKKS